MIWNPQEAQRLARYQCSRCDGKGLLSSALPGPLPLCDCVCRQVFRICHRRFRRCVEADASVRSVSFREMPRGVDRHLVWARRNEDYIADFQAAARRVLRPQLMAVFRFHHLLGASPELVAQRTGSVRSAIFELIVEAETLVGRELAFMQPYSLYPPWAYMRGLSATTAKSNFPEMSGLRI